MLESIKQIILTGIRASNIFFFYLKKKQNLKQFQIQQIAYLKHWVHFEISHNVTEQLHIKYSCKYNFIFNSYLINSSFI